MSPAAYFSFPAASLWETEELSKGGARPRFLVLVNFSQKKWALLWKGREEFRALACVFLEYMFCTGMQRWLLTHHDGLSGGFLLFS